MKQVDKQNHLSLIIRYFKKIIMDNDKIIKYFNKLIFNKNKWYSSVFHFFYINYTAVNIFFI